MDICENCGCDKSLTNDNICPICLEEGGDMKENTIQERIKNLTSSDFLIYVKEDPEFRKFIKAMPAKHWSKHDISAVRLGWEACKILFLFPSLDKEQFLEDIERDIKLVFYPVLVSKEVSPWECQKLINEVVGKIRNIMALNEEKL